MNWNPAANWPTTKKELSKHLSWIRDSDALSLWRGSGQVKVVRLGQDFKVIDFILKATFSKHICHTARTKAYRRSSFQVQRLSCLITGVDSHWSTRSGVTTVSYLLPLNTTFCSWSSFSAWYRNTTTHYRIHSQHFLIFPFSCGFFFLCFVLCFFFLFLFLTLLFTWATGTKILFNTLFIAHHFWWRLLRRPSPQISQRGVLTRFLFGVGTLGGSACVGWN